MNTSTVQFTSKGFFIETQEKLVCTSQIQKVQKHSIYKNTKTNCITNQVTRPNTVSDYDNQHIHFVKRYIWSYMRSFSFHITESEKFYHDRDKKAHMKYLLNEKQEQLTILKYNRRCHSLMSYCGWWSRYQPKMTEYCVGILVDKDDLTNYQLLINYQLLRRTFTYPPTVGKTIVLSTNCWYWRVCWW